MHINSWDFNMLLKSMVGRNSLVCRITTISSIAKKKEKCYLLARNQVSGNDIPIQLLISSIIPWSPIARGLLAKPIGGSSLRSETDGFLKLLFSDEMRESEKEIVNRVEALAKKKGVSMAQIATAWCLSKDSTSPLFSS
jgi:Aldo/keto reductase family